MHITNTQFARSAAMLVVFVAAAFPDVASAAPAARVDFAIGDVRAVSAAGTTRAVARGAQLEQGETINTNSGRAQLRFTDGAFVSLQPRTEFRIDKYRYAGKQGGEESAFFSLLKGGLRTLTGLIGRNKKNDYQVTTTVATIGIRGTEYTIQYGDSITGTVGEGEIEVCNGAGCLSVTNGESYYVQSQDVKPRISSKRTDLPPAPPQNPPPTFAVGENTDPGGNPLPGFILTGTHSSPNLAGADVNTGAGVLLRPVGAAAFDANGILIDLDGVVPASFINGSGNDGFVAWGYFRDNGSFPTTYQYVVGLATPVSDLTSLAGANLTGTYVLTGKTLVMDSSGQAIGSLNNASFTADFAGGDLASTMNWTLSGSSLTSTLTGRASGSNFTLSGPCGTTCTVSADGAFFGPSALRAGFAYVGDGNQWGGVAVFSQTGVSPTSAANLIGTKLISSDQISVP